MHDHTSAAVNVEWNLTQTPAFQPVVGPCTSIVPLYFLTDCCGVVSYTLTKHNGKEMALYNIDAM